jgi:hypothetical protein
MSSTQEYLLQRLERNPALLEQPWADETIRWAELVFCFLDQTRRAEPAVTRHAVTILTMLNLVAPKRLAQLSATQTTVVRHILSEAGWTNEEAETAIAGLAACARAFIREGGAAKILREESGEMRQRLCRRLDNSNEIPGLAAALGHWLQNTCSLPVPIDRAEWERFAQGLGYSYEELIRAADEIDLNVALIDDIIREEKAL